MQSSIGRIGTRIIALIVMILACGLARADVTITPVNYKGWTDALRMTNGTVELIVVPSVGRIMRYAYVGGQNFLWENPTVAGKPIPTGEWLNTGGCKIWPWPQDYWGWPPPAEADQKPHQARIIARNTVRLTSEVVQPWGFRIVRDIQLAPRGTQVYLSNRFVQEIGSSGQPVAVWTVTQVPATGWVIGILLPSSRQLTNYYKLFGDTSFRRIVRDGWYLWVSRNPNDACKLGTDAWCLASPQETPTGRTWFTVRTASTIPRDNGNASYAVGERAQIYSQPDDANALAQGITPYIELELTSPKKMLTKGETITLNLIWELL